MPSQAHSRYTTGSLEHGAALLNAGDPSQALALFEKMLADEPADGLAHYNAGIACHRMKAYDQAIGHYQRAVDALPRLRQAHHNMAQTHAKRNDPGRAMASYQRAMELDPADFKSAYNLSLLLRRAGDDAAAMENCRLAINAKPDFAEAFSTLGLMYGEHHRFAEALVCLEQALLINPSLKEAHFNMGVIFQKCGHYEQGIASYRKALGCDSNYAPALWLSLLSLPMLYRSQDQIEHCRRRFTANLGRLISSVPLATPSKKQFALNGIKTSTNFYLQYQGGDDLELQSTYGQFVHKVMAANYPRWASERPMPPIKPSGKLRIGYVSTFMCHHTIGTFLSGWVENHDRSAFDIHCYHVGRKHDDRTEYFNEISDHFYHFPRDMESAARQIDADRLHLLVYSDIGMDPTTMQLAALRLAPVQCKGWGHPVTTGLPTMDYYLSSDLMEPGNAVGHYSETLIRLPNLALYYQPPTLPRTPKTRADLGLPADKFIYLSTQSIYKYLPQHDDLFPQIARQVPNALFVFISNPSPFATDRFRQRLGIAFKAHGIDPDRYCLFSPRLNIDDFLSLNMAADVLLDSLEWSGGKTTLEAISSGLPVVACPGRFMRGRHAFAILKRIGLADTIGMDKSAYCRIAIRLAHDSTFYRRAKQKLLAGRSNLYNDRSFINALEAFYHTAVHRYQKRDRG